MPGVIALPFAWQFQPVDENEVAARVVQVVMGEPSALLEDFGGPEVRDLKSLAESWLAARQEHRRLINLPVPFRFSGQWAAGNLTTPEHTDGKITFDEYLANRYAAS